MSADTGRETGPTVRGDLSCCIRAGVSPAEQTCTTAAEHGHITCLQKSIEKGFRLNANATSAAARGGHLQCLRLLVQRECRVSRSSFVTAALHDHLDCLQFLCEIKDFPHRDAVDVCVLAAQGGSVRCLCYLAEHGYCVDKLCYTGAASAGHQACLQYLHAQSTPWDEHTMFVSARSGSLACLCYAYKSGCPWWTNDTPVELLSTDSADCILFLDKYCPLPLDAILSEQCIAFLQTLQTQRAAGIWSLSKLSLPSTAQFVILQHASLLCKCECKLRSEDSVT